METLHIDSFPQNRKHLNEFFRGLGQNRSIRTIQIGIDLGESFQSLIPFLRNNDSLHELNFYTFDIGLQCARNIALLLGQQSYLKNLNFDEIDLDDEVFVEIASALRSQPQMEQLHLCRNSVRRNGYAAFGSALEGCLSLRKLHFSTVGDDFDDNDFDGNNVDDEGLLAVAEGLKHCHNLTSLTLHGDGLITEEGPRSLSTLFRSDNCRLEHLELGQMNIGNDGMAVLADGLASLSSLKWLEFWGMSISDRGLQDLVRGLVNCNLEELRLSNNLLTDSVSGMRSLGSLVGRTTSMQVLKLRSSSVTDEGLQSFVEGMANCCSLTELDLSGNRSITANGLTSLLSLLRTEHCTLCTLGILVIELDDDGEASLANGLVGNKSLRTIDLLSLGAKGCAAFSRLLCDTSSVKNTYLSNHTLTHVGYGIPSDVVKYLKWNKSLKDAAAICKILHSHPDIDMTPLFEFNLKCLPLVVGWLEKAKTYLSNVNESTESFQSRQLSAVYKFVRSMPQLAVAGYHSQKTKDNQSDAQKKRKFDQVTGSRVCWLRWGYVRLKDVDLVHLRHFISKA